ncbi:hypothetical protein [Arthrospiribacter ruber]|uniref:Uncharacterized protein n=1 Tax=Arthrospiribacter ruber TaxID=2487934 RepID=A0A951IWV5_9BACT|nr:hypothetical protein [Arthrospiribacter ruber]MBW3467597.1 hypothetical protein [Arthrospiribacter ruber]
MKSFLFPVAISTAFLLVFVTSVFAGLHPAIVMFMFGISPAIVIWMVIKVLKTDVEVKDTFEEKWYEDR